MKKTILITNDDGYDASGLKALIKALSKVAKIFVVAPSSAQSASGHSITLTKPLKFIEVKKDFYKVDDGTPSDCVYLSLVHFFKKKKPDLVVSGINIGSNMGEDITYSGTVAATMEAVLHNIPAIAISQVYNDLDKDITKLKYKLAKKTIKKLAKKMLDNPNLLGHRKILNVNIPPIKPKKCKGMKVTHAGYREYGLEATQNFNPRGKEYFWIGTHPLKWKKTKEGISDFEAIEKGYISLTPIGLDLTCYEEMKNLKKVF